MTNAIKRMAAGLAVAALTSGIIPTAPAQAAPQICSQGYTPAQHEACSECIKAKTPLGTSEQDCWGTPDQSPPQILCNTVGACGQK
jgi:hypothetical protein